MQDQLGNIINLKNIPDRIVSLVPSQTELLFDLGLDNRIEGITKFCIHPKGKVRNKTIIGGTKNFRFEVIDKIKPDLIIGNKEENYKEGIYRLRENYPVWMSDISTIEDALDMINSLAQLTGTEKKGKSIVSEIKNSFENLNQSGRRKTLYFIWNRPYMVAGRETFINHILDRMGLINVASQSRYPELTEDEIRDINPDLILLSSEPFPFKSKHMEQFRLLCPNAEIKIVDGEMFSWYGSRLLQAPSYLNALNL